MNAPVEIPLTKGAVALVDYEDAALVLQHSWYLHFIPTSKPYPRCAIYRPDGKTERIMMHRFLLRPHQGVLVDHRDGNGLNNRRSNLRVCDSTLNNANRRLCSRNTSGFKGVFWQKKGRAWVARIRVDGKLRYLGYYKDPWDAAQAYNRAALDAWGEFALINTRGD